MNFRLRFSMKDDLCLLKEVLAIKPYWDNRRGEDISRTGVRETGKKFSLRSLKEHMMNLLKLWHRDGKANLKKYVSHYLDSAFILEMYWSKCITQVVDRNAVAAELGL